MKRKWGERLRWQLMASLPWRHLKVLSSTVFSSCQLMGSFPIYKHVVPQSLCLNKLKFHIIQNPFAVLNLPKTINAKICNVVQSLSHVQLSVTPWSTACQASLSFTISLSFPKLMSIESVMPSNHLTLCAPFSSCRQSLPVSGSFPVSWLLVSGSQSIGASSSASVLPMNI